MLMKAFFPLFLFLLSIYAKGVINFNVIADPHFDGEFNPLSSAAEFCRGIDDENPVPIPFSVPGCDSSPALLENYFQKNAELNADADFVLVLGDLPGHDHPEETAWEAMEKSVHGMTTAMRPGTRFYPALGNNDIWPDYCTYENTPDYHRLRLLWGEHFPKDAGAAETWDRGAYYAADLIPGELRVVVLNTVMWSDKVGHPKHQPCTARPVADGEDPAGMAAWFEAELRRAEADGVNVWVTGHIPPGFDPYTGDMAFVPAAEALWDTHFAPWFRREGSPITASFFGHRHVDQVQTLGMVDEPGTPSFVVPSACGVNRNFPAVRSWTAVRTPGNEWVVSDYTQWYADIWQANANRRIDWRFDYTFSQAYADYVHRVTLGGRSVPVVDGDTTTGIGSVLLGAESDDPTLGDIIMARMRMHYNWEQVNYGCSTRPFANTDDVTSQCILPRPLGMGRPY